MRRYGIHRIPIFSRTVVCRDINPKVVARPIVKKALAYLRGLVFVYVLPNQFVARDSRWAFDNEWVNTLDQVGVLANRDFAASHL
jgi:hypothetical protein